MTRAVSRCLFFPFPSSPDRIVLVLEPPHPWEPALEGQALEPSCPLWLDLSAVVRAHSIMTLWCALALSHCITFYLG